MLLGLPIALQTFDPLEQVLLWRPFIPLPLSVNPDKFCNTSTYPSSR